MCWSGLLYTSQEQVLAAVDKVNKDDNIHGVLLFRPLPKHLNQTEIENALDPAKDVDLSLIHI